MVWAELERGRAPLLSLPRLLSTFFSLEESHLNEMEFPNGYFSP